jgi:hypothetical protein
VRLGWMNSAAGLAVRQTFVERAVGAIGACASTALTVRRPSADWN